jgi:hypothetical protein
MRSENKEILTNHPMSGDFSTEEILLDDLDGISLQAVFTGSPVGQFTIQFSNQKEESRRVWTTIGDTSINISGEGSSGWSLEGVNHRLIRLTYMRESGDGTCTVIYNGKGQ